MVGGQLEWVFVGAWLVGPATELCLTTVEWVGVGVDGWLRICRLTRLEGSSSAPRNENWNSSTCRSSRSHLTRDATW